MCEKNGRYIVDSVEKATAQSKLLMKIKYTLYRRPFVWAQLAFA